MNNSENFVFNVTNRMSGKLSDEQLRELKQSIYIALYDFDIREKETDLACTEEGANNQLIQQRYYNALKAEGKSPETIARYKLFVSMLLDHSVKPYHEITTDDMRYWLYKYQETRHVSNTTLDGMRRIYSAFFTWLTDEDYIQKNPMRRIAKIKHDTVPEQVFSDTELERLKNACRSSRDRALMELLEASAIRVSEAAKIDLSDIDWETKSIVVHGKGNKVRTVYFNDKAQLYLKLYIASRTDHNPALFTSSQDKTKRTNRRMIEQMVSRVAKRAGVKNAHPHRFRVTKITSLLNRGMPLQDVQELAGHSNINMTRHYYRSSTERVRFEYLKAS